MRNLLLSFSLALFLLSCNDNRTEKKDVPSPSDTSGKKTTDVVPDAPADTSGVVANAATILARTQVPVLCYHHIQDDKPSNEYEVYTSSFKAQLKTLSDSGYHTVLPDQLYNYLTKGTPLPSKPVMLTYDDTDLEQFTVAKTEMDKYGFKGVYFVMTISIGRPRYMSKEQIKQLSDEGHVIASHTWDHHRVDRLKTENTIEYRGKPTVVNEFDFQFTKPKQELEAIIGKPITYFAYPFGLWNKEAIPELEKRGYRMAFILSTARDQQKPLMTVRRIIVAPSWSAEGLLRVMRSSFREATPASSAVAAK